MVSATFILLKAYKQLEILCIERVSGVRIMPSMSIDSFTVYGLCRI